MKSVDNQSEKLIAGAATVDITPLTPQFLFGYPFVDRISTGVNDKLLCTAIYLSNGNHQVMLISNDVIYISKASAGKIRKSISIRLGISESSILVSATHTHSGPVTVNCVNSLNDSVVPPVDIDYLKFLEERIVDAASQAYHSRDFAEAGFLHPSVEGIGTNRHDPSGPYDPEVPVVVIRNMRKEYIACMLVCNMHPTVIHEDSTLFSGDFPAFARERLRMDYLGESCHVAYFTGTAGNQSPRHVVNSNTFEEARRLGDIIAHEVGKSIQAGIDFHPETMLQCLQSLIDLPRRSFPDYPTAMKFRDQAFAKLKRLRETSQNAREIRTAEVDWFGAEELLHLSKMAESNLLETYYATCLPVEIQIVTIGGWKFVAWPGEIFVEYSLELKKKCQDVFVISLSNGELQGYLVTEEAEKNSFYEASNSLFHHSGGAVLVDETVRLLKNTCK